MRLVLGAFCSAMVVIVGCEQARRLPTAPTQVTPVVPPVPGPGVSTVTVFGVVRAIGDVPVEGAKVALIDDRTGDAASALAFTDSNGRYRLPATPIGLHELLVGASKPGHFADFKWTTSLGAEVQIDLALDPVEHVSLGEIVRRAGFNGTCEGVGYGRVQCQRLALTTPSSGSLVVTVSSQRLNGDMDIVRPDGSFARYVPCPCVSPLAIQIPVEAGSTYEIRVTGTPEFELTTALR